MVDYLWDYPSHLSSNIIIIGIVIGKTAKVKAKIKVTVNIGCMMWMWMLM